MSGTSPRGSGGRERRPVHGGERKTARGRWLTTHGRRYGAAFSTSLPEIDRAGGTPGGVGGLRHTDRVSGCRCAIAPPSLLLAVAERGDPEVRDAALRTLLTSASLRSRRASLGPSLGPTRRAG